MKRRALLEQHRLTEREQKSFQLLELVRHRGPLTRTELSQGTGFNIVTVSNYINQFIKNGLISERGFDISTGGRKPVLVELNARAGFAIGIDLGPMGRNRVAGVITNLRGQVVHRVTRARGYGPIDQVLAESVPLVRELLSTSPVERKRIQGIAIGLPGVVDERPGTVRDTSRGGIRTSYVMLREQMEEECQLPVLMGNDATLAGYGELRLGLDRSAENAVYLYSDMGASLIINGHMHWGSGGSAGELGVFVSSDDDYLTWTKTPSFVLPSVWDVGLIQQARKVIEEGHATAIQEKAAQGLGDIRLETVIEAAQEGDAVARELIEHHAMLLGIRVASLVNLLNPDVVILGGGIERAGPLLLEPVWRAVKKYAYAEPAALVDILPAKLGEDAVALGAACWVIREVFVQA